MNHPRTLIDRVMEGIPLTDREWVVLIGYCYPQTRALNPKIEPLLTHVQTRAVKVAFMQHLNLVLAGETV